MLAAFISCGPLGKVRYEGHLQNREDMVELVKKVDCTLEQPIASPMHTPEVRRTS